jgi:hypothetical protein
MNVGEEAASLKLVERAPLGFPPRDRLVLYWINMSAVLCAFSFGKISGACERSTRSRPLLRCSSARSFVAKTPSVENVGYWRSQKTRDW